MMTTTTPIMLWLASFSLLGLLVTPLPTTSALAASRVGRRLRFDVKFNMGDKDDHIWWANDCDWDGGDFAKVDVDITKCGEACQDNQECTHFKYHEGMCWLKTFLDPADNQKPDFSKKPFYQAGSMCGKVKSHWRKDGLEIRWSNNCEWDGGDSAVDPIEVDIGTCGQKCQEQKQCTHFEYFDGKCHLMKFSKFVIPRGKQGHMCGKVVGKRFMVVGLTDKEVDIDAWKCSGQEMMTWFNDLHPECTSGQGCIKHVACSGSELHLNAMKVQAGKNVINAMFEAIRIAFEKGTEDRCLDCEANEWQECACKRRSSPKQVQVAYFMTLEEDNDLLGEMTAEFVNDNDKKSGFCGSGAPGVIAATLATMAQNPGAGALGALALFVACV